MIKRFVRFLIVATLLISTISFLGQSVSAKTTIVMWGKTELKIGQIGKVTVLRDTPVVKLDTNGNMSVVKRVSKGEEFRVYSYQNKFGGLYGLGGGLFVQKNESGVKYETPSKTKMALLNGNPYVNPVQVPKPGDVKDKNAIYKEKLNTIKNTKYNSYKEYANEVFKLHQEVGTNNYNMHQELSEAYFNYGIEVSEVILEFNDGTKFLAFKRSPEQYSHGVPTNRSATLYNNEYYLSVPILEYILNAHMNTYSAQKAPNSYDGKFFISGSSAQTSTEFKNVNDKKAGHYSTVSLTNFFDNKSMSISEKEYPFVSGGAGLSYSSIINPYSLDEVKAMLDMKFDLTYDKTSERMTIYFDKPVKENALW